MFPDENGKATNSDFPRLIDKNDIRVGDTIRRTYVWKSNGVSGTQNVEGTVSAIESRDFKVVGGGWLSRDNPDATWELLDRPESPTPDEPTREAAVVRFSDGNDNYLATLTDRPSLWLSEYHDNYDVEPLVSWADILGAATPGSIEVLFKGVGE